MSPILCMWSGDHSDPGARGQRQTCPGMRDCRDMHPALGWWETSGRTPLCPCTGRQDRSQDRLRALAWWSEKVLDPGCLAGLAALATESPRAPSRSAASSSKPGLGQQWDLWMGCIESAHCGHLG